MELFTFTAASLPEALRLVRQELGPDASVLHARETGSLFNRLLRGPRVEVIASRVIAAPSRWPVDLPQDEGEA